MSFKRHEDALDSYRQALKWLDWAKMDREKRNAQQTEIQKWLRLFDGAKVIKNGKLPSQKNRITEGFRSVFHSSLGGNRDVS